MLEEYPVNLSDIVEIKFKAAAQKGKVWIVENGKPVLIVDNIDLLPYSTEEAGGFVGCTIGMYATSNGNIDNEMNYADFVWFHYDDN